MIFNLELCIDSNYYGKTGELPHQIWQSPHLSCVACMDFYIEITLKVQIVTIRQLWQIDSPNSLIVTFELCNIHGEFTLK